MRFVASQADLAASLAVASRAVSNRNPMPILSGVLVRASGGQVLLHGTDLTVGIETTVTADVAAEGAVVLPSRFFADIVRRVPAGPVSVQVDPVSHTATVEWDRARFTVHGQPADHFPYAEPDGGQPDFRLPQNRLRDLIRQTVFAVSQDVTRAILTGVHVSFEPPLATMLATDSFRMVRSRGEAQALPGGGGPAQAVLPARTMQELGRLLGDTGADADVRMTDRRVTFDLGSTRLFSRVLDGEFPTDAITRLVEGAVPATTARLPLSQLHDACERALLLVRGDSDQVRVEVTGAELTVLAVAAELGQMQEELPADVTGDPLEIYLNPQLLLDALRALDADEIVLEFTGARSPVRLRTGDSDHFLYGVMPQAARVW